MSRFVKLLKRKTADSIAGRPRWRNSLYRLTTRAMELEPEASHRGWQTIDPVYMGTRRLLAANPSWRFGTRHVYDTTFDAFDRLTQHIDLVGRDYCELGCGKHHPYGTSAVFYLNGIRSSLATDILDVDDESRAAVALFDLLLDCLAFPQRWHWSHLPVGDFLDRARHFDLGALREGRLFDGVEGVPIRHCVTDIYDPIIERNSIDAMSSRAVLEHFLDFSLAAKRLFEIMRPGSIAFHLIDLADHRIYGSSQDFHYLSFLTEEEWHGHTNRLRAHEIRDELSSAGFGILDFEPEYADLPEGLRDQLKDRFRHMTDEQLSIIRVMCTLKKPDS